MVNSASVDIISEFFSQNRVASHEVFQLAFTTKKSLTLSNLVRLNASPVSKLMSFIEYTFISSRLFYLEAKKGSSLIDLVLLPEET